jgi:hypothetical protein
MIPNGVLGSPIAKYKEITNSLAAQASAHYHRFPTASIRFRGSLLLQRRPLAPRGDFLPSHLFSILLSAALLAAAAVTAAGAPAGGRAADPSPPGGLAAAGAPAADGSADPAELRRLPTVVKVWSRKMSAEHVVVRPPAVYVKSGGQLTALVLRSGRELWSRHLGEGSCCGDDLLVTDSTVVGAADDKLFFLSAADGTTRSELALEGGGGISALAGPPVVALLAGAHELVAIDAEAGQVTGRLPVDGEVEDLAVAGGYALANLAGTDAETRITAGFSADTLRPLWRIETRAALPQLERIGDRVYLERWRGGKEGDSEFLPIDPATGRLGRALPPRGGNPIDAGWPWEIQSLPAGDGEMRERLRRNDAESGKAVWTTELPCRVQGLARSAGTLYASCGRGGGRGLLVTVGWAKGEIQQLAYGLPRGHAFLVGGDLAVVAGEDELAAFSLRDVGPPEAGRPVEDEVRRILLDTRGDDSPLDRGQWIDDRLRELEPLGPAAYPAIVRLLPQLGPTSLVAAADVLAAGGHRAAAPALARLLGGELERPRPGPGWEGWNPRFALLRALARLAGDPEVPAIAALLERGGPGGVRREAFATLVALRSPAADRAVRAWLAGPRAGGARPAGWSPPGPPEASSAAAGELLTAGLPDGRRLVLFRHGYLGSPDDLWVAEIARDGRPAGPARFTGARLPPLELEDEAPARGEAQTRRVRVTGDAVEVLDGAGRRLAAFSLAETARDSDGDGVPDVAERRLRLDPARADTDGDGLSDAEDPAPNARLRRPLNEQQEIAAAIFRQFFALEEGPGRAGRREIAVVVSDFALEWRGRRDITITLDAREAERFRAETGGGGIPMVSIHPGEPPAITPVSGDPPAAAAAQAAARDEEVYTVTIDRGPLHAVTYRVVIRNLDAAQPGAPHLWALRSLRPAWIG